MQADTEVHPRMTGTYDIAFDAGREAVLGEMVCSVCGWNHDRDESAACDGCEAVRFDEWVARMREQERTP